MKNTIKSLLTLTLMLVTAVSAFAGANISSVTVAAQTGTLNYGTPGSATFAITSSGSGSGTVTWSIVGSLPAGATALFSPASTSGNGSWATTLTISTTNSTPPGATTITVQGSGNSTVQNTGTLTIGKRTLTGVVAVDNKVYDGGTTATITNRSLTGSVVAGDVVSLAGGTANFNTKNVGAGKTVNVTGLSLSGAAAGNYTLASSNATTSASITVRTLTVSATASNKTYNGNATAAVALTDNRVSGDVLTTSYTSAAFDDKNVGTNKNVSVTGINVTGTDSGNYSFNTTANDTANITARALAVSATGVNKTYDGNTNATVNLGNDKVSGDDVTPASGAAFFANKNIGTAKTVTVTGINLGGADAGNYSFNTTTTTTADITAKGVAASILADNKVYDGNTTATVTNRSLTGVVGGDAVGVAAGSATFDTRNVGSGKTVTETGLSLNGAGAGNYSLDSTTATTTANITLRLLTISATASNKVYNGNATAVVILSDDRVSGDTLSTTFALALFDDKNTGTNKNVSVTGINVTGADATNYTFNTTASATADILKKSLTVTIAADNKVYDGNATASITNRVLTGVVDTEDVTLVAGTATFPDKHVGTGKTVTESGLSLTGTDSGNYVLASTSATTSASITARSLTVGATGVDKGYDGNATATVNLNDNRVGGDTLTITYGAAAFDDKNAGTNKNVSVTGIDVAGSDSGEYTFNTSTSTTASILVASLTAGISADNKVYDGTDAATITNRSLTGIIGSDSVSLVAGVAKFSDKNVGAGKTVTETGLGLTGAGAANYVLASTTATTSASITARALTVGAAGVNKIYDGTTNATVTLSDDRVSGDVLTTSYLAASFATKTIGNGKPVSVTGIDVTGSDSGNYTFNTTASTTANITGATVTGHVSIANKTYDGLANASIAGRSLVGAAGGDDVSLAGGTAAFATPTVGNGKLVTVTGLSLSGADSGNYSLASSTVLTNANITAAVITVTADDKTRVYGAPDPAFTVSYGGFVSGEDFSVLSGIPALSTTATLASSVVGGPYAIVVTNGTLAAPNYTFAFVNGQLTITPARSTNVVVSAPNPALPGATVTFSAALTAVQPSSGTPAGVAQFLLDGSPFGAPVAISNGLAVKTSASLTHGYHALTVRYAGDGNFTGSTNGLATEELINTPPVASNDNVTAVVNQPSVIAVSTLTANDADADGDSFSFTGASAASAQGGGVAVLGGTVTYTPPFNYAGADSFTYTITDLYGATANGTVNITIPSPTSQITQIQRLVDKNIRLTVSGTTGLTYRLQMATNLKAPTTWVFISTNTSGISGSYTVDDLKATNSAARYYRTVWP